MGWRALGDSAWLCEPGGGDAGARLDRVLALGALIEETRIPQVTDVVGSFDSVAVHFDPSDGETVLDRLLGLPPLVAGGGLPAGRQFELPVSYCGEDGPDLAAVAGVLGIEGSELAALHAGPEYRVAAVGFAPGFPYLTGVDPRLDVPRKRSPARVAAGSVAIAGGQAGVYPFASQGGWHVLGRTDAVLFDPARERPALLRPGDRVRFRPANLGPPAVAPAFASAGPGDVEVIDPGPFSSIQGLGRPGWRACGVSAGGAADPVAAVAANLLAGNPDGAAVIECSARGPVLRFDRECVAAWIGWAGEAAGRPQRIPAGGQLDLRGGMNLMRGYIAVAGGFDVPMVLGSRATDLRGCFGGHRGGLLRQGEALAIGHAQSIGRTGGEGWKVGWPRPQGHLELRFLPGMQESWFTDEAKCCLRGAPFRTTARGDRTGLRLDGPGLHTAIRREMVSQPVAAGSIQVPPDGAPIILLGECQTIGGYPQIGHVISADLPALARALPDTPISFREVGLDEARAAWASLQRALAMLETGLRMVAKGQQG